MPCDSIRAYTGQTLTQRIDQVKEALKRLERYLASGTVRLQIGPQGAVAFQSWRDRDDITDVCAIRTLMAQNSPALRVAMARAEAQQGRRVNLQAIAAGYHSHDSGRTWGKD